ncbi:MAG: DUF2147 domain-containing protein [Variibacter sp.]|nr:DUF2147 domain-containing protein [Variibacter sp.]
MRMLSAIVAAWLASTAVAAAADPIGEWMVKDKVATIRIENCSGKYWGVVSWEKMPGGIDRNNPDVAKRNRPTLGMPVLLAMKPTEPNMWEGQIYNSKDGKTYDASISLESPDVLAVRGCILGFLCGGENWTRVRPENNGRGGPARPTSKDICSGIAKLSGLAH